MRIIKLVEYDPMEELIDRQLASLWSSFISVLNRSKSTRVGGRNYMEDMFIQALDLKYHRFEHRKDFVFELAMNGFTSEEISSLTGISRRTVQRDIEHLKIEKTSNEINRLLEERNGKGRS